MSPRADSLEALRASYRFAADGSRAARLRIDQQVFPVEILDESAEGFGILFDGLLECYVGESVAIETATGWSGARIMRVQVVEPAGHSDEQPGTARTRLGLKRVEDLPSERLTATRRQTLRTLARAVGPPGSSWAGVALTVAIVVFAVGGLVWVLDYMKPNVEIESRDLGDPVQVTAALEQTPRGRSTAEKTLSGPQRLAVARAPRSLPDEIICLTRPELLLKPKVARQLALSPAQQKQLQIIQETHAPEAEGPEADQELGERVMAVLTPEQRQTWWQVVSQPGFLDAQNVQP